MIFIDAPALSVRAKLPPEGQAERFRKSWEKLRDRPKHQVRFHIIEPDGSIQDFRISEPPARNHREDNTKASLKKWGTHPQVISRWYEAS